MFEEETQGFYYRVVKMTQDLKGGNGSAKAMGDPSTAQDSEEWKKNLAEKLVEADNLPEDHMRMLIKGQFTQRAHAAHLNQYEVKDPKTGQPVINPVTGAPLKESYHSFNPDQYLLQCNLTDAEIESFKTNHPKAYEAYRRWVAAAIRLEIGTDLGMIGDLPTDSPPHMQKLAAKIMEVMAKPLTEEVRIAQQVERRTAAFEYAYRELRTELVDRMRESLAPDIKKLGDLLDTTYKRIETQEKQLTNIREDAVKFTDQLKLKVAAVQAEADKKEQSIIALKGLLGDLTQEKENLAKDLEGKTLESAKHRKWYDDASKLSDTQKAQLAHELEKNGRLEKAKNDLEKKLSRTRAGVWTGWIAATAASILGAGLWFYQPSLHPVVENVPQEVITYSKERVTVRFGDVKYEMSADRFTQIYDEFPLMQQKAGRHLTPSERKKYFDSKADNMRYIKDLPKGK